MKTGNLLVDHAGKLGLAALLCGVGYFARNWKGGKAEEDAREEIGKQQSISVGEVRELRASNPNFGLAEFEYFAMEAWAEYPNGRVTWPAFQQMVQTDCASLVAPVLNRP